MGCEDIRDLLALYAGGECYDNERIAVEAHVSLCSGCARELDQYREARAALAGLADQETPETPWKSIWSGVRAEVFPHRVRRAVSFDAILRCAAALMVGLAIGVVAYTARGGPPAIVRSAAAPEHRPAARPALVIEPSPVEPRLHAPRARSEGNFYLPRVEAIPAGGEKDF
jgi:anti-sigma factor RsiW